MGAITLPTLYKLTNANKIQTWSICYGPDPDCGARYTVTFGQLDGKLQTTTTYIDSGKNLGRANATNPLSQAESEARALWVKQRDRKGYTEDIPTEKPFRPMLAKSYEDVAHKIIYPAYAQVKLDGIRCITFIKDNKIVYLSRTGKEFKALRHLDPYLFPLLKDGRVLDGELYNHSFWSNFQSLVSAIKRDAPSNLTKHIQYHVYDCISDDDYSERFKIVRECDNEYVKFVGVDEVTSVDMIDKLHDEYVRLGYEGLILRNKRGPYELNKRSSNLIKYKKFNDAEFEVVGAEENVGKQAGECTILCKTFENKIFGVKPLGSTEVRRQYWEDFNNGKLVGKLLTVRYFGLTDDNIPRFPIGVTIRDYET